MNCAKPGVTGFNVWKRIAVTNLMVVALAGSLLRAKILFPMPWIDHKFLLHAHSHFAFSGWLVQAISVCCVEWLAKRTMINKKLVTWLFIVNMVASFGMLFTFPFMGYAGLSIFFSALSILFNSWFAVMCLRLLNQCCASKTIKLLFRIALLSLLLSGIGPLALPVAIHFFSLLNLEIPLVYWFLHFQYNGFFTFSVAALFLSQRKETELHSRLLHFSALLMGTALVPSYLLALQWMSLPFLLQVAASTSGIIQLVGLILFGLFLKKNNMRFSNSYYMLAAIAFVLKIIFQALSIIPSIGKIAFGYRPIVIGYLHLVLLGCVTIFLVGYFRGSWTEWNKSVKRGTKLFVMFVVLNEVLLFAQGFFSLQSVMFPYINELLLTAALGMLTGLVIMNVSLWKGSTISCSYPALSMSAAFPKP